MVGHFAVDQQRHANLCHAFEDAHDVRNVGNAVRAAGCRVGGVELRRGEHPRSMAARHLVGVAAVGQIGDDQRREVMVGRNRGADAVAVGSALARRRHRRRQVRHDDRARELARGIRRDMIEHRAVAKVHMPVVGAADRQAVGHRETRQLAGWFWLPRP
jgi:hypothetical protein